MKTGLKCCCMGCAERHQGCHGTCDKYAAYKAECKTKRDETARRNIVAEVHNDNRKRLVRKYDLDKERGKS